MESVHRIHKCFKYSRKELRQVYNRVVRFAQDAFNEGNYKDCCDLIGAAAHFQYGFNDIIRTIDLMY